MEKVSQPCDRWRETALVTTPRCFPTLKTPITLISAVENLEGEELRQ
jgi:hypothetical protein